MIDIYKPKIRMMILVPGWLVMLFNIFTQNAILEDKSVMTIINLINLFYMVYFAILFFRLDMLKFDRLHNRAWRNRTGFEDI